MYIKEYFYKLADAVRHLAPEARDSHLEALEVMPCPLMIQRFYLNIIMQTRIRQLDREHGLDDINLQAVVNTTKPYVIFGYGSLVFKVLLH